MSQLFDLGPTRAIRPEERSDAPTPSLGELARTSFDDAVKVTNFDSMSKLVEEGYDSVNDRIKAATGEELENPTRWGAFSKLPPHMRVMGGEAWTPEFAQSAWNKRIAELKAKAPDALPWDDLVNEPLVRAGETMRQTRQRQEEAMTARGMVDKSHLGVLGQIPILGSASALAINVARDPAGVAAQFGGSLAGQMTSPADAIANLLPFGVLQNQAAKSLIKNAAANAAANAGIQAVLSAGKMEDYKKAGLPYGWKVWLEEVEGAAATGAVLDLAIRGPGRAAIRRFGTDTPAGTTFSRNTERGGLFTDAPDRTIAPEVFQKAQEGDIAAAREIAEKTGAINDPAIKGAFDYLEGTGKLTDEALAELEKMGIVRPDGFRVLSDAIEGRVPEMPEPVRPATEPLMREEGSALVRERAGELEALMREASPLLTGGHPRLAQFIEDAVEAGSARYVTMVREALDGVRAGRAVAEEARSFVAKLQEIVRENPERFAAEVELRTSTSPLAIADSVRRFPEIVDTNTALDTDIVRMGRSIARLDDAAYGHAQRGLVPPQVAAMVAERVPRAHQGRVIEDLAKARPETLEEARALVDELVPESRTETVPLDGGGERIDDPNGAAAKAQTEVLKQEAGRAYEEAFAPVEERQRLESEVETIRGAIAKMEMEEARGKASAARIGEVRQGLEVTSKSLQQIDDQISLLDAIDARLEWLRDGAEGDDPVVGGKRWEKARDALEALIPGSRQGRIDDRIEALESKRRDIVQMQTVTRPHLQAKFDTLEREARLIADEARTQETGQPTRDGPEAKLSAKRTELKEAEAKLEQVRAQLLAAISDTPEGPRDPLPDGAVRAAVEREIRAMLPDDVVVRVLDRIDAVGDVDPYGLFDPAYLSIDPLTHEEVLTQAVLIAARGSAGNMLAIGRHEVIHALRASNLFTDEEWRTLVDNAVRHKIDERMEVYDPEGNLVPGIPYYAREYRADLKSRGLSGDELETRLAEVLDQERVAWMAEQWQRKTIKFSKKIDALLERAMQFLEAIARALDGLGIRSLDDFVANREAARVAEGVMSGEIGRRPPRGAEPGSRAYAIRHDIDTGQSMRRDLDALGYYSQALEAAKSWTQKKGTPEQALMWLKKSGVKDAEIEATGLRTFLEGKQSVTREEVVGHLEGNRVRLKQSVYRGKEYDPDDLEQSTSSSRPAKWAAYSLDPDNQTYRETVLHLPFNNERLTAINSRLDELVDPVNDLRTRPADNMSKADMDEYDRLVAERDALLAEREQIQAILFRSGHFPEPNIIGHMMTSMTTHQGKPVYTIDQIQSDWGQRLRDDGVKDDAKIADLKSRLADLEEQTSSQRTEIARIFQSVDQSDSKHKITSETGVGEMAVIADMWLDWLTAEQAAVVRPFVAAAKESKLVYAELLSAEAATSGNPLVNTTDQWVNTTLRRAIRQAAEADAEYIAIPSGETVLSYNPGDTHGMGEFYGKIVPKNLRNLLSKIDKASPDPQRIDTLDSPSGKTGLGKGFTLFPLTDKVKSSVMTEGQPLFALGGWRPSFMRKPPERIASDYRYIAAKKPREIIDGIEVRRTVASKNGGVNYHLFENGEQIGELLIDAPRRLPMTRADEFDAIAEGYEKIERRQPIAGTVTRIEVAEGRRGEGLGSKLLDIAEADLKEAGAILHPGDTNMTQDFINLYAKRDQGMLRDAFDRAGIQRNDDPSLMLDRALRERERQGKPLFALRGNRPSDEPPVPPIKSDIAFVDRLNQIKDLVEACRA